MWFWAKCFFASPSSYVRWTQQRAPHRAAVRIKSECLWRRVAQLHSESQVLLLLSRKPPSWCIYSEVIRRIPGPVSTMTELCHWALPSIPFILSEVSLSCQCVLALNLWPFCLSITGNLRYRYLKPCLAFSVSKWRTWAGWLAQLGEACGGLTTWAHSVTCVPEESGFPQFVLWLPYLSCSICTYTK